MIQAIPKEYCTNSYAQLLTQYNSNSIIIDSKELLFLSNKDVMIHKRLEEAKQEKLPCSSFEKNEVRAKILYKYREPHLQIMFMNGKLYIRSLYFVNASKCAFYSSTEDNGKGMQQSFSLSKETAEDFFQYHEDSDSFYILNRNGNLLTAINMVDGMMKNEFDVNKAIQSQKDRNSKGYHYVMIKTKDGRIKAEYFSLRKRNKEIEVRTKEIPVSEIDIYDVIKEASTKQIPYTIEPQYPELSLEEQLEKIDKEKEKSYSIGYHAAMSIGKNNNDQSRKQKKFGSILKRKSKI